MSLKIKYWGVRGSIPSANSPSENIYELQKHMLAFFKAGYSKAEHIEEFIESMSIPRLGGFGSATTCVQAYTENASLLIDAGSGLRRYSDFLNKNKQNSIPKVFHIYLTHFHWDHLLGLPFFSPLFSGNFEVNFYAVEDDLESAIKLKFSRPFFPVAYEALRSKIKFIKLKPRVPYPIGDMTITPYRLDHPDPCWGLKVEHSGKVYSHCVDTEGTRTSREELGIDLPLYQNVDLMYFDAQYTFPELAEKANWGHSAAQIGLDIAIREAIPKVIFAHHDPGANTSDLYNLIAQTREYYTWRKQTAETNHQLFHEVKWRFAYEDLSITIS